MSTPENQQAPAEFGPEPGWSLLQMPRTFGAGRSFVSGELDGDRLRIWYYRREADGALCAKVWFGYGAEGPPGHAHGGSMAAVLDEAMGFAAWVNGHPVVAATITINFRKRLPLEKVLHVECFVDSVDAKKVTTKGRIHDPESGAVFSEGEGTFVKQPIESFGRLIEATNEHQRLASAAKGPSAPGAD
jgi:acyl-coenzyme A thioesterase PaaI-like protein